MFSAIDRFFSNLTGSQRLLAFIFVVAVVTTLVAFLAGGWTTGVPIGILVLAILWLTRPLWKPSGHGNARIRLTSLTVISGVALAVAGKTPEAKPVLTTLLTRFGLEHSAAQQVVASDRLLSTLVLTFVLLGVFIVNYFTRDDSAMQEHPKPLDQDFPEQTYRQQLKRFSEILTTRLTTLDEETKWDDYFFAPLDAEVEVISGRRSVKKIVDLMRALKADRASRVILVLGDPGAGKSIALRKLAKELMKEVDRTGRVPVYVNLKEWDSENQWTEKAPPTIQEFRRSILGTLRGQSSFADLFLEQFFDRMLDRGRFFFIFDSFDEIPGVLDVSEASWLILHLSQLITEFFVGQDSGRGIVASRFYRRPKFNPAESSTFEIRPFSDLRIHEALLRSSKLRKDTVEKLFTTRTELIPIARNPFSAALIRIYAENHGGDLPANQLEMYESYVRFRLDSSSEQVQKFGLTIDYLMAGATDIAWCMFEAAEIGLEASVPRLAELLPSTRLQDITAVLRYSGLARISATAEARFSFTHRRLNEYFVACKFLKDPARIALQAIPTDSRYRDALALYCEVGDLPHVKRIARFCWEEISNVGPGTATSQHLRAIHCLRFLRDAFHTRPACLEFIHDLAEYISERIQPGGDLLAAKIALEATGLLPEYETESILVRSFNMRSSWISETALHACRHLKQIGEDLEQKLFTYLSSIPIREYLNRDREITFSLSLSDGFRRLRKYCKLRSFDNRIFVVALALCVIISPILALIAFPILIYIDVMFGWLAGLLVPYFKSDFLLFIRDQGESVRSLVAGRWIISLMIADVSLSMLSPALARNASTDQFRNFYVVVLQATQFIHGHIVPYIAAISFMIALALFPWLAVKTFFQQTEWRFLCPRRRLPTSERS
jgi:NACHT domain